MKLRNKIYLSTAVLFIGLFVIINFSVYFIFSDSILDSEIEQAHAEAEQAAHEISQSIDEISANILLPAHLPIDGMIQIVTTNQKAAHKSWSPSEKKLTHRPVQFFNNEKNVRIEYEGTNYAFQSIPIILQNGEIGNLQFFKSMQMTVDDLSILRYVLITVTIIAMIPVFLSSRILSSLITKPIISLIETMTEIRKSGQFKRIELKEGTKDELYQMGETFNHMIDLLEANFEKQDQFVANASHELRTPLTIIESYASLLKRRGINDLDLFRESIEAIHSESIRMKSLIEQLLQLARHQENWRMQPEEIELGNHVVQMVKAFEKAYRRNVELHVPKEEILTRADGKMLKQLIYIFLDNAGKYSEDVISVEVGRKEGEPYIQISDRGIGIPKEDLPKVFDRFYRVDKARSRQMGGSGLGLSLAKEIADAMDASLTLVSTEGSGTTVTITLPPHNHSNK
nr:HAMP domain-containing sensor histidine kinase [uncultured Bacillus sp.]